MTLSPYQYRLSALATHKIMAASKSIGDFGRMVRFGHAVLEFQDDDVGFYRITASGLEAFELIRNKLCQQR